MVYGDVKFAYNGKVEIVDECTNEPMSVCHQYVRDNRRSNAFIGGILLVNSIINR